MGEIRGILAGVSVRNVTSWGQKVNAMVAEGRRAKGGVLSFDPDVVVEINCAAYTALSMDGSV